MYAFLETRSYRSDFPVNAFYASDNNFLAHWHIEVEMVLVREGSIRVGINQESRVLNQGDMAVFGSTDIHFYDSREMHSAITVLIFRPELIGSPGGWPENLCFHPAFIDKKLLGKLDRPACIRFHEIFDSIVTEMNGQKPFYELYVRGKIFELCAMILRYIPTRNLNFSEKSRKLPDIQRIQSAIQFLENNYMHDISLPEISQRSALSPYYFSRLFNKFTGISFKEYLARIRIDRAERLIKSNQKSIIDISFECGFNSVRTFNRTYRAIKGYPPSKIRQGKDESR